jgi:hypothetical protein
MVDLARPDDHGEDDPRGSLPQGRVLSAPLDPDGLLSALQEAAGEPPLAALRLADPTPSARRGPAGRLVSSARRAVVRLIAPALADLLGQLERDRHRQRGEIARLERRVAELERERGH